MIEFGFARNLVIQKRDVSKLVIRIGQKKKVRVISCRSEGQSKHLTHTNHFVSLRKFSQIGVIAQSMILLPQMQNTNPRKNPQPIKQFHMAMQIVGTLNCPVIGLGAGIVLDNHFDTQPWLMFVLLFGCIAFTAHSIYTTVKLNQKRKLIRKSHE